MNKIGNKTLYVRNPEVWDDAEAKADKLGIAVSALVERALISFLYDRSNTASEKLLKIRDILEAE